MIEQTTRYGIGTTVDLPYTDAVAKVRQALATEGFGVLTEIDVAATMKAKLGSVPSSSAPATAAGPPPSRGLDIGLLLPCNVIVYEADTGAQRVAALDPVMQLSGTTRRPLAMEVGPARAGAGAGGRALAI
jgi:uncharacterized protein (DUF302 family)